MSSARRLSVRAASRGSGAVEGGAARFGVEFVGHRPQLAENGPAGRLGGVGREHRPDRQPVHRLGDLRGRYAPVADLLGGTVQPAAVAGPLPAQFPGPVRLFGHVGQMEVGGKGTGELGGRRHIDVGQAPCRGGAVGADEPAHLLDKIEEALPFLPDQGLAEQDAQAANVGPECGVESNGLDEIAFRHGYPLLRARGQFPRGTSLSGHGDGIGYPAAAECAASLPALALG